MARYAIVAVTITEGRFNEQDFQRDDHEVAETVKAIMSFTGIHAIQIVRIPDGEVKRTWG